MLCTNSDFTVMVLGILEENKPFYFPKGTFLEITLKYSTRKDLQDLYRMAERLNSLVEYKGKYQILYN